MAYYLRKSGCYVTVYTRTKAQAEELNENGISFIRDNDKTNVSIHSIAF
ncbi:hypothetical protein KHA80_19130 [Anaerobacillus sp. HL2]|nr:hypothetical protein KHA80_19130 [Anaerobacillus sp. HL2]